MLSLYVLNHALGLVYGRWTDKKGSLHGHWLGGVCWKLEVVTTHTGAHKLAAAIVLQLGWALAESVSINYTDEKNNQYTGL